MTPPVFETCILSSAVTTALGSNPTRLYPFGQAPQNVSGTYAVWQSVGGSPENYLGQTPDIDSYSLQFDVYGDTSAQVRAAAKALRNAIEPVAHIVAWRGESREAATMDYRYSFDVEWFVSR